mgnify:FL=1
MNRLSLSATLLHIALIASAATAQNQPLHTAIDESVLKAGGKAADSAQLTSDAEFQRRATLDLTGRIPSLDAARRFLADTSPDKRTKLLSLIHI